MSRDKQNFCEQCLHYRACLLNSEYVPSPCSCYEDKADYRKASEVARGIFEEIDTMISGSIIPNECAIISTFQLAKLKKKYTESENNNG